MTKFEPYKIKSIRKIPFLSQTERRNLLRENNFNVNLISGNKITFDLVTQGSSAMSQEQVGALFIGDEAYAGARNFYKLLSTIQNIFNFKYVCPLHNLHGGLKLLSSIFIEQNKLVFANTNAAKEIVEYFSGEFKLLATASQDKFPGNIDTAELTNLFEQHQGRIPYIYQSYR